MNIEIPADLVLAEVTQQRDRALTELAIFQALYKRAQQELDTLKADNAS